MTFSHTMLTGYTAAAATVRMLTALLLAATFVSGYTQETEAYDYHQPADAMVTLGRQALMICNGLFVSNRTLDQIYEQELKLYRMPVLPPNMVTIDEERRVVTVGGGGNSPIPPMRAVFREGVGAVLMAPHQTLEEIDELPELTMAPITGDPDKIPWPNGDLIEKNPLPRHVNGDALQSAAEWAFDRDRYGHSSQITLSLLVVHQGDIILERYGPGVDISTKTRTWSTAKSIASTLIGILVDQGKLSLDGPLPFDNWQPVSANGQASLDPRRQITLRNVLNMSSGLYPVDNERCHIVGSCLSYWAGAGSVNGALDRGLVREPGTHWDYENYDTILAVLAFKTAIRDGDAYLEFPRRALLDKIGMRNTVPGVDRFGDFILSSQVYTNARDLGRLGLLYLNEGTWSGERILSKDWIAFSRTPALSTANLGRFYAGHWWLPPDDRKDVPQDAYSTAGHRGQYTVVIPSYDLIIVRRGLDWLPGQHRFSQWDLTREVLKAFTKRPWGSKTEARSTARTQK